eukprot:1183097-Rhodomonas_salina.2
MFFLQGNFSPEVPGFCPSMGAVGLVVAARGSEPPLRCLPSKRYSRSGEVLPPDVCRTWGRNSRCLHVGQDLVCGVRAKGGHGAALKGGRERGP